MKKARKDAPHVRLYFAMIESPAWPALSSSARTLFVEVLFEWAGGDPNCIKLPYADLRRRFGWSPATISDAFLHLEHFGFITRICGGGLFRGASVYGLSHGWQKIRAADQITEIRAKIEKDKAERSKKRNPKTGAIMISRKPKAGPLLPGNYKDSQKLTLTAARRPPLTTSEMNVVDTVSNVEQG